MLFRQLFDRETSTYSYLLADEKTREAVFIDSVLERVGQDAELIEQLGLRLLYVLDTHVHADHVTGAGRLREIFGAQTVVATSAGVECADHRVNDGDVVVFGSHALVVRQTPGHTAGDVTLILRGGGIAFTGDTLLIRGCGRTDFQQGNARALYRSVHEVIFSLPDETLLYPGHDYNGRTVTTVREEKDHNPRLGQGRTESEFEAVMEALQLPYPARLETSLPANQNCGSVEEAKGPQVAGEWTAVERSEDAVPEVAATWVHANATKIGVRVIDVRSSEEFQSNLGHIQGAILVPMETLAAKAAEWRRDDTMVVVCRSGRRSVTAAVELERMGFSAVASMRGGMLAWVEAGLPQSSGAMQ